MLDHVSLNLIAGPPNSARAGEVLGGFRENLTRDPEAGAELTRMANQDRLDALQETQSRATSVGAA